jgi:DNA-binding transcriptional LysR family regulator
MELRQLEHFLAVAEEGHFTRAASRCRMSQSALSASIHSLEKDLDSRLFVRTTRKVQLTEAGRVLLGEARRTLAAAASARESVLAVQGLLRGSLRVGGIPTPGLLDQAALLASFRDHHPAVDIRYVRDTSMALIPQIEAGRLDVALVSRPRQLPEPVLATPLSTQPLMFVCRPGHPLASRTQVTPASLAEQDFVGPPQGTTGYEAIDRVLARTGQERRVIFEAVDVLTILDFVAHGLGFALLPEYLATSRPDLRAIPLAGLDMTWTLAAIMSRHQATPAARAFAALLPQPGPPQQPRPSPRLPARLGPVTAQGHRGGPKTRTAQLCATSSTEPEDRRAPAATDSGAPRARIRRSARRPPGFRVTLRNRRWSAQRANSRRSGRMAASRRSPAEECRSRHSGRGRRPGEERAVGGGLAGPAGIRRSAGVAR